VTPVSLEGEVIWTQASMSPDLRQRHVSGVRLHANTDTIERVVKRLQDLGRSHRVRDRRFSDRFLVRQPIDGQFEGTGEVRIIDLSTKGTRFETATCLAPGTEALFSFPIPRSTFEVRSRAKVIWCRIAAIWSENEFRYHTGLRIVERPELMRLAIGQLSELKLAIKDTQSLKLKLRIARAIDAGPEISHATVQDSVPGSEYFPLLESVRAYLEQDPEERRHWGEIAAVTASSPDIRALAGPIRESIEALAVWEYLERSIDPSIIALSFEHHA